MNIHGSFLPKYRGRTPHVWAIINGEKETGITAHLITIGCDKGGILFQTIVPIEKEDTGGSVLQKYKVEYPNLIDKVIHAVLADSVHITVQDESKATCYPKRTPDDGEISFYWQKERIYNWVRAMAPPEYPGAFFYDGSTKVIVSKVVFCDMGFGLGTQNGAILYKDEEKKVEVLFMSSDKKAVVTGSDFEKKFEIIDFYAPVKQAQKRIEENDVLISVLFRIYIDIMNDSTCQVYQFS